MGYPEEVNLAYDANSQRIAMIWKGGFIDSSRHRNGRGQGYQGPLGQEVLKLVEGAPFALLENAESPWPGDYGKKAGFKMGGYRLDKRRRPSFFYSFGSVRIEDFPVTVESKGSLFRGCCRLSLPKAPGACGSGRPPGALRLWRVEGTGSMES